MNRSFVFAGLLAATFISTAAFADDITIDPHTFVSTRTRAEVQAELAQYQQAGVNPWSISYNPLRSFRSVRSRDEVQAEFTSAREEVHARNGEDSGAAWIAQHQSGQAASTFALLPVAR